VSASGKPAGLLAQWKLLGEVTRSPWARRLEIAVSYEIIDRHYARFGVARAGLRFLEQSTGASRSRIAASIRKLVEHGVITVARKGKGTRPTEYGVNFDFTTESVEGTKSHPLRSGDKSVPATGDESVPSSGPSGDQLVPETYLRSMLTSMPTGSRKDNTHAAPTAPPLACFRRAHSSPHRRAAV
jgi:hypothetical protein